MSSNKVSFLVGIACFVVAVSMAACTTTVATPVPPTPTAFVVETATQLPIEMVESTATVIAGTNGERSTEDACETNYTPVWELPDGNWETLRSSLSVDRQKRYEEEVPKDYYSSIFSPLPNGSFSVEFKFAEPANTSFAFMFRSHIDHRVKINGGEAADYFVITRRTDQNGISNISWQHLVFNHFVEDYAAAKIIDGEIEEGQLNFGPRGWNGLRIILDDDKATVFLDDSLLTTLELDHAQIAHSYTNTWLTGYFSDDDNSSVYIRNPDIACID